MLSSSKETAAEKKKGTTYAMTYTLPISVPMAAQPPCPTITPFVYTNVSSYPCSQKHQDEMLKDSSNAFSTQNAKTTAYAVGTEPHDQFSASRVAVTVCPREEKGFEAVWSSESPAPPRPRTPIKKMPVTSSYTAPLPSPAVSYRSQSRSPPKKIVSPRRGADVNEKASPTSDKTAWSKFAGFRASFCNALGKYCCGEYNGVSRRRARFHRYHDYRRLPNLDNPILYCEPGWPPVPATIFYNRYSHWPGYTPWAPPTWVYGSEKDCRWGCNRSDVLHRRMPGVISPLYRELYCPNCAHPMSPSRLGITDVRYSDQEHYHKLNSCYV